MSISKYPTAIEKFIPLCPAQRPGFKLQDLNHAAEYFGSLGWKIVKIHADAVITTPRWEVLRPKHPFGGFEFLTTRTLEKWWRRHARALCVDARNAGIVLSHYQTANSREKSDMAEWAQSVSNYDADGAAWESTYSNITEPFAFQDRLPSKWLPLAWAAEKAGLNSDASLGRFILKEFRKIDTEHKTH